MSRSYRHLRQDILIAVLHSRNQGCHCLVLSTHRTAHKKRDRKSGFPSVAWKCFRSIFTYRTGTARVVLSSGQRYIECHYLQAVVIYVGDASLVPPNGYINLSSGAPWLSLGTFQSRNLRTPMSPVSFQYRSIFGSVRVLSNV